MLAIAPERVAIERAEPGDRRPMATLWPLLARSGVASVSRNGVLGDPTGASAEEGLRLLDQAADELVGLVGRLEEGANTEVAG
jgi:creatinine amidohydrolase